MSYEVIARRWRPQQFDAVVGQAHVTVTLRNALRLGRLAHAYLFVGPRGVGKTSTARILAKAVNCEQLTADAQPCDTCETCRAIVAGRALDIVEIDAASNNSVDDMRDLRDRVRFPPAAARRKVYIIDEVHMLSTAAFNAFLKTLEEPPDHCLFIMATTEAHKIPATILSRCQRFDFRRITTRDIATRLTQICESPDTPIAHEPGLLLEIARAGDGSMRDAESLLDQVIACGDRAVTADATELVLGSVSFARQQAFVEAIRIGDAAGLLEQVGGIAASGKDLHQLVRDLAAYARNLMVAAETGDASLLDLGEEDATSLVEHAKQFSPGAALKMLDTFVDLDSRFRFATSGRIALELAALKLARWGGEVDAVDVLEQIAALESKLGGGGAPPPVPGATGAEAASAPRRSRPQSQPTGNRGTGARMARESAPIARGATAVARPAAAPAASGSQWEQFMARIKIAKRPAFFHAANGRLGRVDERSVEIVLPAQDKYNKDFLTDKRTLPTLEQAAAQVWGGPRRVVVLLEDEPAAAVADAPLTPPEPAPPQDDPAAREPEFDAVDTTPDTSRDAVADRMARNLEREEAVLRDPMVQSVLDRFDARITEIDDA